MPVALPRAAFRLAMLVLALLVVLHWKIGPVLLSFDPPGTLLDGHGVHTGDGLALLPALLAVPWRRAGKQLDRRVGVKAPVVPNPGRRASDHGEG